MNKIIILALLVFSSITSGHVIRQYPDAPLEIITIGHPTLRMTATEVTDEEIHSGEFQDLIDDMVKKMREANGVGLAAPQVNVSKRMFVMKPSMFKKPEAIINPLVEYLENKGTKNSTEGCLSIPGKSFTVKRFKQINLSYQDRHGDHHKERAKGFRAIVIQHEYDHLNGTLISDFFIKALKLDDEFEFTYPLM